MKADNPATTNQEIVFAALFLEFEKVVKERKRR